VRPTRQHRMLEPFQPQDEERTSSDSDPQDVNTTGKEAFDHMPVINHPESNPQNAMSPFQPSNGPNLGRSSAKHRLTAHGSPSQAATDSINMAFPAMLEQQVNDVPTVNHGKKALSYAQIGARIKSLDVTQHTFQVQNSQRQLKLVAKNEARCWHFVIICILILANSVNFINGLHQSSELPPRVTGQESIDSIVCTNQIKRSRSVAC